MSASQTGSALERLRQRRQDAGAAEARTLDVLVPDSDEVYLRLGYLDPEKLDAIARRIQGKKSRARAGDTLRHNVAVIVEACRGVFVREAGEHGEHRLVSIDPDNPSEEPKDWPRIGPRLGELLGVEKADAMSVLIGLVGDEWAVQAVAARYNEWLIPVTEDLDEQHQGE